MIAAPVSDLKPHLKEVFGYHTFRGEQEAIVRNILGGRDTFVIMPTGAGKSLCYQLPAVMLPGTAIVISPLIALMKNQVDQLDALGVNAQFLNSTLNKADMMRVRRDTLSGKVKLLYVAPESLNKEENLHFLKRANLSFIAIDEAHCISEWGHDFRPEYRRIRGIIEQLGKLPIIALTATATPKVQLDIQRNLQMEDAALYKSSFNREHLFYEIRPKKDAKKQLIRYVRRHKNKSGIIYCLSRKKVEEIAELLRVNDVNARPYHAGLEGSVRMGNQDAFLNEDCDVVVATIAFGMGIDKPDIRFVVHYDAPKSLEGYYQETGRGGRDGLGCDCTLFYSPHDIAKLEKFSKDKSVTERDNARHLLHEMAAYAESSICRRRQLLHYFGEELLEDCGFCDNCARKRDSHEVLEEASMALSTVRHTQERFVVKHLIEVLRGERNDYINSYGHDQLATFGRGAAHDVPYWKNLFRQLLVDGLLKKDIDNFGVFHLTPRGAAYLERPHPVQVYPDRDFSNLSIEAEDQERADTSNDSYDAKLFDLLRSLRKRLAKEKGLPPYVLFQDPSLQEMATTYPTTREELTGINGVGMGKAVKFGRPFLEAINRYVEENDITTATDVVVKSTVNKSKVKIYIIQQIDRKVPLDEVARAKGLEMPELITEVENICFSGTRLN
ncbi:MAG: DNA helicase RecQ, partial [Catalinimonas sp.]